MRLAVSNIALPSYDHGDLLPRLAEIGFASIEVAPSRAWQSGGAVGAAEVAIYLRQIEAAGLTVCGLHSLFFDRPDLSIFGDQTLRAATADYLVQLSALCRDLGGRTLIFGSPQARRRGDIDPDTAENMAADLFTDVAARIAGHGTAICLEPLREGETDFISSAAQSLALVTRVALPALRVQLDFRAITFSRELTAAAVDAAAPYLAHVHVNADDLGVVPADDAPLHRRFAALLSNAGYGGFVSLEQRMSQDGDPLDAVARSMSVLKEAYTSHD